MKLVEDLRGVLGEASVGQQEPLQVDGVSLGVVATPESVDAFSDALRTLCEDDRSALVTGGGTRLGFGNPPTRAELLLSTGGLRGIRELDAEEGVVQVYAGTPLSEIRDASRAAGWELPMDPPGGSTTLGGALAAAAIGPRFGHPRSVVLGLDMLSADGTFTRCGGRVVKNVTGYDLAKLYVGSLGTLGVIAGAWLRLLPLPEATEFLRLTVPRSEAGFERAVGAARHTTVRVAALLAPELAVSGGCAEDTVELVIELAGDAAAVLRDGEELRDVYAAEEAGAECVAAVREHQFAEGVEDSPVSLFASVRVLPSKLWSAWNRLAEHGALCFAYPARGDLFARIELRASTSIASVFEALEESAAMAGGSYAVESAPLSVKREYDVFGQEPELRALTASMKQAFDPTGVLNAGRFAGRQ